jgi:serine/threonine protein kinase
LAIDADLPSRPSCVIQQLWLSNLDAQTASTAMELFCRGAVQLDTLGAHPQIPQLLAHFEHNQLLYLVREYIEGQTLAEEIATQRPWRESQVRQFLLELLPVLQFIHDRQAIHGDIKPAHIIRRQGDRRLMLIDFGMVQCSTGLISLQPGLLGGCPEYLAPEQQRGQAVPASDLYSLGVVCLQLLINRSPFDLFDGEQDCWNWRDALPQFARISHRLGVILDRLLQRGLSQRFQSAQQVLQALEDDSLTVATGTGPSLAAPVAVSTPAIDSSEVFIRYDSLRDLLAQGDWQAADDETWNLLRQLLHKSPQAYVFSTELRRLPCEELQTMDQLWQHYSQGRYGFMVQAILYCEEEKDYGRFCHRVGWSPAHPSDSIQRWQLGISAPMGHWPSCRAIGGQQWWRHLAVMTERLECCLDVQFSALADS